METVNKINARAYEIFLARLYWNMPGDELSDWLTAEAEINHVSQFHKRYDITTEVQNEIDHASYYKSINRSGTRIPG